MPGTSAKVAFQTGALAGYTFEISKFDNAIRQFTILLNKQETAYADGIPNTLIRPAIGDQYILVDINMPQAYVDAAETALQAKAQLVLDTYSDPVYTYKVKFDPTYLRGKLFVPSIGQVVFLVDSQLQVDKQIRITTATRNILNEWQVDVELSDVLTTGILTQIASAVNSNSSSINNLSNTVDNNSLLTKGVNVGDLTIKQGTIVAADLSSAPAGGTYRQIVVDPATGKFYYQ